MKFRPQRSTLAEAMDQMVEIEPTEEALAQAMNKIYRMDLHDDRRFLPGQITVEPYWFDERINWDTYIVMAQGSVYGFTDGPLGKPESGA